MPPLKYHAGQIAIQNEAKTTHIADQLAFWIGPVVEFAREVDLIFLAMADDNGVLKFSVISGKARLIEVIEETTAVHRFRPGEEASNHDLRLRIRPGVAPQVAAPTPCGGLVFNYANARRARINGILHSSGIYTEWRTTETFTLCRKYISPSRPLTETPNLGPASRQQIALDDPWLTKLVAQSDSMFLATISPNGAPDVTHRGGPKGFLNLDPQAGRFTWHEFVGDGVFKSAGNVRSTGIITVLIPDLETGGGVELIGTATYKNLRSGRGQRTNPLEQHSDDFPLQGVMTCDIQRAFRLTQLMAPRYRIETRRAITSCAPEHEQAPQ
jgi:hypothetical protein